MKQESEQEGVRNIERQTEGEGGVVQDGSDRVARCCNCCISCEANRYRVLTRTPEDYACRRSLCLNAASFFLCFYPFGSPGAYSPWPPRSWEQEADFQVLVVQKSGRCFF